MKKRELARFIYHVSRANGTMRLHPDSASGEFFDKYLFQSDPFILSEITEHLSTIVPVDSEVLAGLEMGGIPIAAALSLRTNLPLALVRKEPKENGAKKLAEGADVRNRRVCIVEDIIGTGGQAIVRSNDLRQLWRPSPQCAVCHRTRPES